MFLLVQTNQTQHDLRTRESSETSIPRSVVQVDPEMRWTLLIGVLAPVVVALIFKSRL